MSLKRLAENKTIDLIRKLATYVSRGFLSKIFSSTLNRAGLNVGIEAVSDIFGRKVRRQGANECTCT